MVNRSTYLNKGAVGGYIVQANHFEDELRRDFDNRNIQCAFAAKDTQRKATSLLSNLRLAVLSDNTAVIYTGIYYTSEGISYIPAELVSQIGPALQRWKISEAVLPPGSEIQFRVPNVWEQYRLHILAILAALILQGAMITWLVYERWRRQAAEAQSMQQMHEMARMNRFATAGELSASLAHEIRQPLAAISASGRAGLSWLKRQVPNLDEVSEALEMVAKESLRADDVIKGVKAMFKHELTARTKVNLNQLVQQIIALAGGPYIQTTSRSK